MSTTPEIIKLHIWRLADTPTNEQPWVVSEHIAGGLTTLDPPCFETFDEAVEHAEWFWKQDPQVVCGEVAA
jgi:hypothetical protein